MQITMKVIDSNPRKRIIEVVQEYKAILAPTYGPAGQGVLIQKGTKVELVDDGQKASNAIEVKNELHNAVMTFLKEGAEKTNSRVGDGTTTAAIIMADLVLNILKEKEFSLEPAKSYRKEANQLKIAVKEAVAAIQKASKKVKGKSELEAIAYNSFNDQVISKLIADLVDKTGPQGVITVEESQGVETESSIVQGLEIDKGYASPYLAQGTETRIKDASFLVSNKAFDRFSDLAGLLEGPIKAGQRDHIVIAESFGDEVIAGVVVNNARGAFKVMLIQAPSYGDHKKSLLEDIAVLTGAKVLDVKLDNEVQFGRAEKVLVSKSQTTIINSATQEEVLKYAKTLSLAAKEGNPLEQERILKRAAALVGGVGIIKVGADTESEMFTLKAKVEDAVHATQAAQRSGIVEGAGKTYAKITTSSSYLNEALKAPRRQLEENGKEYLDEKVYDPAEVLIAALESAVSIAAGLITMGSIIAEKKEEKDTGFSLD